MKTTLSLDNDLMRRVKAEAAVRGITMSALIESALRRMLDQPEDDTDLPPLPSWASGGLRVDVSNREALYEAMEGG